MPRHSCLAVAEYFDQFCFSVSRAVVSSARQDSLLRPRTTAPRPAASQLGPVWSVGTSSARTGAANPAATSAATDTVLMKPANMGDPCVDWARRPGSSLARRSSAMLGGSAAALLRDD